MPPSTKESPVIRMESGLQIPSLLEFIAESTRELQQFLRDNHLIAPERLMITVPAYKVAVGTLLLLAGEFKTWEVGKALMAMNGNVTDHKAYGRACEELVKAIKRSALHSNPPL